MENKDSYDVTKEELPMPSLSGHMWKQYGNKIECTSCPSHHVAFLQPGIYISGYKNGVPLISKMTMDSTSTHL